MSDYGAPITPEEPKKNNTTLIIVIVVAVLLLCCCCVIFVVLAWNYGDQFMNQFSGLFQTLNLLV